MSSGSDLLERAGRVRLILTDVDGVLTDGRIWFFDDGREAKAFNVKDGLGLVQARRAGLVTGIVTGRSSEAAVRRAGELGMEEVHTRVADKAAVLTEILARRGLVPDDVAFVGDDLNDLPLLDLVGLSAAPCDAVAEVRKRVRFVTRSAGGQGAVREVVDLVLAARRSRRV